MIKAKAFIMSFDEFEKLVNKVSGGRVKIGFESNDWFFDDDTGYDDDEYYDIYVGLAEHLGIECIAIYTDFTHVLQEIVIVNK